MDEKINDILFLSILFPRNDQMYSKNMKSHRSQNISAIQYMLWDSMVASNENHCNMLNTLLVPLFPKGYKVPIVCGSKIAIEGNGDGFCHPFLNIRGIYSSSLFYGAKGKLKQWAEKKVSNGPKIAIAYSLTVYTLKAMRYLKKLNPEIKTAIIIPDIPQYTYVESKNLFVNARNSVAKRRIKHTTKELFPYVDKAILFSEKMTEQIDCAGKYLVFEGVYSEQFEFIAEKRMFFPDIREIIYAGGLREEYGVKLLLNAFAQIKHPEYRLILAGRGPMEPVILEAAKQDSRIVFLGEVQREKLLALEKGADILVNPRVNSGIFTRYSFPSKNMEYLSSGTPMIGYKLEGIPNVYDQFINYFEKETPEALAEVIEKVCSSERDLAQEKANRARQYVAKYKNGTFWGEEIIKFIKSDQRKEEN